MEDIFSYYTPDQAWNELTERKKYYYDTYNATYSGDHVMLATTAIPGSFWKRGGKVKLHVPVAADIANTAAELLFGEEPRFEVYDTLKGSTEDGSLDRLMEIITENMMLQKLHEAAETASADGDVYLKCRYDKEGADVPIIDFVRGDSAVPEYRLGKLVCVHFFSILKIERDKGRYWRVYERYEDGKITSMVFCGDSSGLGNEYPSVLNDLGIEEEVLTPSGLMLATHVVNAKPSRIWLTQDKGRSDFEGLRDMLDSLDEIYTSWMRDVRLAKARLIVPAEYLRKRPNSNMFSDSSYTFEFDEDVETLVALDMVNDREMKITPSQFQIRAEEHAKTFATTLQTIINMAGYSPQTFGLNVEGSTQSGVSRKILEKKTADTTKKKQAYWARPLGSFLTAVMHLDRELYGNREFHEEDTVRVEMHDPSLSDPKDIAATISLLKNAEAASTEVLVKMQHNDWTQKQIDEEIEKINLQYGINTITPVPKMGDNEPKE